MKKFLSVVLVALTMIVFTACGNSANNSAAPAQTSEPADKILVAYFSCTGNTKKVALEVAKILGADTFEIVPLQPYTPADLDYQIEGCRANLEQQNSNARPIIESKIDNPAQYKAIVIAFPIWWGAEPRIIDTFVESYNLKGKTIVPVCTSGGSEILTAEKNLQELCKGVDFKEGKRLGVMSDDDLKAWLKSLDL